MRNFKIQYILIAPALVLFLLFTAWPILEVTRLSFIKTNYIITEYVGIKNYKTLLTDRAFLTSIKNNLLYMVFIVPGVLLSVVGISLTAFQMSKKWQDVTRFIVYIPVLSAGIIIAQVWKWIYHIDGPINYLLKEPISFFSRGSTGIPAIAIIMIYQMMGGYVIIFLANLMSIDKSIFDAAKIDGASQRQINRKIILPLMLKPIGMITLLIMIASMQIVETIMMLAPYEYTASITYHIYREGFIFSKYGTAAAASIILLIITIALTLVKNRLSRGEI